MMVTQRINVAGNGKHIAASRRNNYTPGEHFIAVVKKVRPEGVYIDRSDVGSGTISPRCWGTGQARLKALARIRPGDQFEVEVVSWDALTKTLSLVLAGTGRMANQNSVSRNAKPQFKPIPAGSTLLFDFANLVGNFSPRADQAPFALQLLESVESQLVAVGYKTHFFVEHRTLSWVCAHLPNSDDKAHFQKLCARPEAVTVVCGEKTEADLPLLQTAAMLPNAVCVSCDRFRDYAVAFPDIVGSERIRTFTFMRVVGNVMLSIDGIQNAVLVRQPICHVPEAEKATEEAENSDAPTENKPSQPTAGIAPVPPHASHSRETEIRLLSIAARKDPAKYLMLADLYSSSDKAEDRKLAAKFEALGMKRKKSLRESRIRDQRRYAQQKLMECDSTSHLSARRQRKAKRRTCAAIASHRFFDTCKIAG